MVFAMEKVKLADAEQPNQTDANLIHARISLGYRLLSTAEANY